jgi:hypothetical protein
MGQKVEKQLWCLIGETSYSYQMESLKLNVFKTWLFTRVIFPHYDVLKVRGQ